MAGKKQLPPVRLVGPEDKAEPSTVAAAFESGDRLAELRAMYRVLAAHIDHENTLARDLAALMRQAREISKEIEALEVQEAEAERKVGSVNGAADAEWKPQAI